MEVVNRAPTVTSCDGTESTILACLEFFKACRAQKRCPNGSTVIGDGPTDSFEGDVQCLFGLAPRCPREGFQNVDTFGHFIGDGRGMMVECIESVENDSKDFRSTVKRKASSIEANLRMVVGLSSIRGEQSDGGFCDRDDEGVVGKER